MLGVKTKQEKYELSSIQNVESHWTNRLHLLFEIIMMRLFSEEKYIDNYQALLARAARHFLHRSMKLIASDVWAAMRFRPERVGSVAVCRELSACRVLVSHTLSQVRGIRNSSQVLTKFTMMGAMLSYVFQLRRFLCPAQRN